MSYQEIAATLGVHRNTVSKWCRSYVANGISAIISKRRGIRKGMNRTLTEDQEKDVRHCIVDKMPDQYKLTFALWTRQAVRELIRLRTGISMPIRTVGEYLGRWGFTPQKPLRKAYEQRPQAVKAWLNEEYPIIRERARAENAEIHWGDETGIRSDSQHGRSYAPRGKTPAIAISAKRTSVNMISSVTNQGKIRFMLYEKTLNAQLLIKFMERLGKDASKKVYLILDNLRVHHAGVVQTWLAEHTDIIEVFYLPSYSPELNPDEYLNCDLKAGVHSLPPVRTAKGLKRAVISHMRKIQTSPMRVVKYFEHPKIRYAAW